MIHITQICVPYFMCYFSLEMANMLGPNPPPTPTEKVANIPLLQPPPAHSRSHRTSPQLGAASNNFSRQSVAASPVSSAAVAPAGQSNMRSVHLSNSSSGSGASSTRSPEKNKTAHVRPFSQTATQPAGMGDVRGASANWRPLTDGRVDLLAGQRQQLKQYGPNGRPSQRLDESFGSNHSGGSSDTYGTRDGNSGVR
jgi:hypothetical protein